jgi:hypothetical protein
MLMVAEVALGEDVRRTRRLADGVLEVMSRIEGPPPAGPDGRVQNGGGESPA